jgi:hypothetical protein
MICSKHLQAKLLRILRPSSLDKHVAINAVVNQRTYLSDLRFPEKPNLVWRSATNLIVVCLILFTPVASAATAAEDFPADPVGCCRSRNVPADCVQSLCNPASPPGDIAVFNAIKVCPSHLPDVSQCLANGRNHSACCLKSSKIFRYKCLHICDGTTVALNGSEWDTYQRYMACLSFNVRPMYACIAAGYLISPTPPLELQLTQSGSDFASLRWKVPKVLPEKVLQYRISYRKLQKTTKKETTVEIFTTRDTHHQLASLRPDTKYTAHVEAIGNGDYASLPSKPVIFVTHGVAPEVTAHSATEQTTPGSLATLACRVRIHGSEDKAAISFAWQKQNQKTGNWQELVTTSSKRGGNKNIIRGPLQMKAYQVPIIMAPRNKNKSNEVDDDDGRHYVITLQIKASTTNHCGDFRCVAKNGFGQGFATVQLTRAQLGPPPRAPSNATACCEHQISASCCSSVARSSDKVDPFSFICTKQVPVVLLRCWMAGMNYDSCCLANRVPSHCLLFCHGGSYQEGTDGGILSRSTFPLLDQCLQFVNAILNCHLEAKKSLPNPPSQLQLSDDAGSSNIRLQWEQTPKAKRYTVYYRRTSGRLLSQRNATQARWRSQSTFRSRTVLSLRVPTANYDVIVVAANEAGISENSRTIKFRLEDGKLTEASGTSSV